MESEEERTPFTWWVASPMLSCWRRSPFRDGKKKMRVPMNRILGAASARANSLRPSCRCQRQCAHSQRRHERVRTDLSSIYRLFAAIGNLPHIFFVSLCCALSVRRPCPTLPLSQRSCCLTASVVRSLMRVAQLAGRSSSTTILVMAARVQWRSLLGTFFKILP